jgi:hypothetical protein
MQRRHRMQAGQASGNELDSSHDLPAPAHGRNNGHEAQGSLKLGVSGGEAT